MPSLYASTVPVMTQVITAQLNLLKEGATHAASQNIDLADMTKWKLVDDMLPLYAQVLISNTATRKSIDRLTGRTGDAETPKLERKEMSYDECTTALNDTLAMLAALKPADIDGREAVPTEMAFFDTQYGLSTEKYVSAWTLPTLFFHLDATYMILRLKGVPLGKKHYQAAFLEGTEIIAKK